MDASEALRTHILDHARHLERFAGDILACDVVVEKAERHHHQGDRFNAHVRIAMRGRKIDAGHTPAADHRHEDPYIAVTDAFNALRRRVEDYTRRRRGDVKTRAGT